MENFKTLLNNCSSQYDYVKIGDLEQGKKYEVSVFNYVETKYGKKNICYIR